MNKKGTRRWAYTLSALSLLLLLLAAPLVVPQGDKTSWINLVGWSMVTIGVFLPLWERIKAIFQ